MCDINGKNVYDLIKRALFLHINISTTFLTLSAIPWYNIIVTVSGR